MKNSSIKLVLATFLVAAFPFSNKLFAQGSLGLHFSGANPIQNFADSNYNNNYGFGLEFMSKSLFPRSNVKTPIGMHIGGKLDYHFAGSERVDVVLATPNNDNGFYRLSNGNFGAFGLLRISGPDATIQPYFDGFLGTRFFQTREKIRLKGFKSVEGYDNATVNSIEETWTFTGGISVGTLFSLSESSSFDIRLNRSFGSNASYADLSSLTKEGNEPYFITRNSITDQVSLQLGFVFKIGCDCNSSSETTTRQPNRKDEKIRINRPASEPSKPLIIKPNPEPTFEPKPQH